MNEIESAAATQDFLRQLRESEERFRLLSESSLEGITLSENQIIIDANEQFAKMFGYDSAKEVIGKNLDDFLLSSERARVHKKIQEENTESYELSCVKKNGDTIIVKSKGRIIPFHGRTVRISVLSDITQEKKYEENIRQSEARYRHLFEHNMAAVFRSEVGGKLVDFNQSLASIFGYSSVEELKKAKAQDLYYSLRDRERYLKDLHEKGFVKNYQMKMKKKDGSEIWILENVQLVKDEKTNSEYIEGTLIDITETKRIEQALEQSEKNYRSLIDHTPDGLLIHDDNGEVFFANPAAFKIMGINSLEDIADKNIFNYVLPEFHDKVRARKTEIQKGKETPFMETKIRRPDGKIVEVETKTSRINFRGISAVEVVLHDISLQRQLEREQIRLQMEEETTRELKREIASHIRTRQRLNANQKYTRSLLDSSIDMICACDENGNITEFNHAAQEALGYSLNDMFGKNISMLYSDAEQYERIKYSISEEEKFVGEVIHKKKSRDTFIAYTSASSLHNEQGESIGFMTISRDITHIKETEERLRKSLGEKEILLKEIHHRVKNNLQVISSILKLQSAYVKDEKIAEVLKECRNRISSMAFIHANLYMTKDFTNINFAEYAGNLAGNLQQSYTGGDKKFLLKMDIPEVFLHIDQAIPCGLIINELLSNSLKYAFQNRKRGTLGISAKVKKENIILAIWDDGAGFPKTVNYRETESLGLQLVISLVDQLNGKIKMETVKDKGTKFIIAFRKNERQLS